MDGLDEVIADAIRFVLGIEREYTQDDFALCGG
jgi:hypothetical protein